MKAFTQIVLLGSASFVPFMQLTANDRRMIIEDLLDIQIFSSMNLVVKDRINSLKNEAAEIKRNVETTKSQIEIQETYIKESKKNSSDQIQSKEDELKKIKVEISEWANKGVLIGKHRDAMSKSLEKNLQGFQSKKKEFDSLEIKIESNLNKIEKNLNFFTHNLLCPTCDQAINNKEIKIEEFKKDRDKYKNGLGELRDQKITIEDNLRKALEVQRKISDHTTEIKGIEATIKQLRKYEDKLKLELEELKNKKDVRDEILELSNQLQTKMIDLENQKKDYVDKKQYIEIASSLLKDSGIKAKIIKQYLPIINKLVNKYLSAMNFFVNFEIDEEFKETIKSRYRDDFSYSNFSEGERMRIDLALMLTWRSVAKMKNSMNTNLLVLDEVFDSSLDSSGTEEFMKLLNSLGSDVNIFVISHKGDVLMDKFTNVIKFEKRQNFSEIGVQ
jgi:DNA repair exonuclease SbcCD ATPase subunit